MRSSLENLIKSAHGAPRHHRILVISAVITLVSGCASNELNVLSNRLVSPEQERSDLERAWKQGAISDTEYRMLLIKVR